MKQCSLCGKLTNFRDSFGSPCCSDCVAEMQRALKIFERIVINNLPPEQFALPKREASYFDTRNKKR